MIEAILIMQLIDEGMLRLGDDGIRTILEGNGLSRLRSGWFVFL